MIKKLEKLDKNLFEYVKVNIEKIYPKLKDIESMFAEYTDHSCNHSERIIKIATLLNGKNELNKFEIALFILSSYYHDIGMYVSKEQYKKVNAKLKKKPEYNNLKESIIISDKIDNIDKVDFFLTLDHIRANHGNLTNEFINNKFSKADKSSYYLKDYYLWEYVKYICLSHTLDSEQLLLSPYGVKKSIGNNTIINLTYLSTLLRLSDICHFSKDRALPYFRKTKEFHSKKSESIWKYYGEVNDTEPDPESNTINIHATCKNFHNHRSIIMQSRNIQKELMNCHKILVDTKSEYSFPWKYVNTNNVISGDNSDYQYYESHFKLNISKITSLLMGNRLYRNKLFAIRESLQNAIDSTYVFNKKLPKNENYIYIDYKDESSDIVLDIFDSGTGMDKDIINKHFLSVADESFWYTKRCIQDWGSYKKHDQIIADHGIGALSYFMLSDKIEIFSVYHITGEHNHILIDNYESDVIFLNTSINEFPKFGDNVPLSTPWDLRHGTCIRFHLKKEISKSDLIEFLSKHILRIHGNLYLGYNDEIKQLSKIWHFRENIDKHCFGKGKNFYFREKIEKKENDFEILYNICYIPPWDQFVNPPSDLSIEQNQFFEFNDMIGFNININYSNNSSMPCRISQNGILIEDAIDFIISKQTINSLFIKAYGFDLNVSGRFQFQLDAERTRIINSEYNSSIYEKIVHALNKRYFKLLSKIESTTYFSCGRIFYHGISDILFPHPNLNIYFHENLSEVFDIENNKILSTEYDFLELNSANLYNIGFKGNNAISINDIKTMKLINIIIINDSLSDKTIKRSGWNDEKIVTEEANEVINKIKDMKNCNSMIYIPLNKKGFILPLLLNFDFEISKNEKHFKILNILEKDDQSLKDKIDIFGIKGNENNENL